MRTTTITHQRLRPLSSLLLSIMLLMAPSLKAQVVIPDPVDGVLTITVTADYDSRTMILHVVGIILLA